jgi:hypothetical protein
MIEQARHASLSTQSIKPISPRLLPLVSPGPVTPIELEESAEYLVAGSQSAEGNQQELVGRMIRAEEERERREGRSSPVAKVGGF